MNEGKSVKEDWECNGKVKAKWERINEGKGVKGEWESYGPRRGDG